MKKSLLILTLFSFITAPVLTSCNNESSSEKVEDAQTEVAEANKDLDKANEEYMADMQNYKNETEAKIKANQVSISEFNTRIANQKKAAKAEYTKKIADLEQKNTDMKKKLDDYKSDGKENWENFKTEFNQDMDELGRAFKDFTIKNEK